MFLFEKINKCANIIYPKVIVHVSALILTPGFELTHPRTLHGHGIYMYHIYMYYIHVQETFYKVSKIEMFQRIINFKKSQN